MFTSCEVMPGVFHIRDPLGVYMTLLAGSDRALLIDTGYGLEDAAAYVRSLTALPVSVLLTHAHHDHALGAQHFPSVSLLPPDLALYDLYTSPARREAVARQAQAAGVTAADGYTASAYPAPQAAQAGDIDLGGMTAQVIPCPGHTPGSAVVYVPERRLLLTGDDWNPCTWLFFPEALSTEDYRRNVRALLDLPFERALCSHRGDLYPRSAVEAFITGLTDDALRAARRVDLGHPVDTREAAPAEGQVFVFDYSKTALQREEE